MRFIDSRMTWGASHMPRTTGKSKQMNLEMLPSAMPYGAMDTFQYHTPLSAQLPGRDLDTILLCSHEMLLPDHSTLHTRMLLGAWECGLEGVTEEAAHLMLLALQVSACAGCHAHGCHDHGCHAHGCHDHGCHAHGCHDHGCHDHGCHDHGCHDHGCHAHGCHNHGCHDHGCHDHG